MKTTPLIVFFLALLIFPKGADALVLYDIDFNSPLHALGQKVTVDGSINTPSEIVFGSPEIEYYDSSMDQSLSFNTLGNMPNFYYDQIKLRLDQGLDKYSVSFDFYSSNYVGSGSPNQMVLVFDTPTVRNMYFKPDGSIEWWHPVPSVRDTFGRFTDDQKYHIDIFLDLINEEINVYLNNAWSYSALFTTTGGDIEAMRFSFGRRLSISPTFNSDKFYIDNLFVSDNELPVGAHVPEPTTIAFFGIAITGFVIFRRRR